MNAFAIKLSEWQKAQKVKEKSIVPLKLYEPKKKELVVNGDILWKPVNREAAKLLSKASWLAQPLYDQKFIETRPASTPKRNAKGDQINPRPPADKLTKRKHMKSIVIDQTKSQACQFGTQAAYVSTGGVKVRMVNGEAMMDSEDLYRVIADEITKLPKETRPNVKAAEDARRIIGELLMGIGADMDRFRSDTKRYLEEIRQTRFAVVKEAADMTSPLREVRQFFLGSDYKEEITRLREFVDLCERLHKLKESGFLDSVADTMLRLA